MLLSIIVPVYNVQRYLDDCVKSILCQEMTDFELILVDDGSPDESPRICDEWAKKDLRVKVIHKKNGGLSDARNCGMEAAIGDYVWFVDSDDLITKNALQNIRECILMFPQADMLSTQILLWQDGKYSLHNSVVSSTMVVLSNSDYVLKGYAVMPSVKYIVKLSMYRKCKLQFIKGVLHEDIPFTHMLMGLAKNIAVLPEPTYIYRIREGSITTTPCIKSCYSLVESYKHIVEFKKVNIAPEEEPWFLNLMYDYFYEIFLRIYPFLGKKEYDEFMAEHGDYVKREFNKIKIGMHGKRKILLYIFNISPKLFSYLIYKKRGSH